MSTVRLLEPGLDRLFGVDAKETTLDPYSMVCLAMMTTLRFRIIFACFGIKLFGFVRWVFSGFIIPCEIGAGVVVLLVRMKYEGAHIGGLGQRMPCIFLL